jgi:hypothetical protein
MAIKKIAEQAMVDAGGTVTHHQISGISKQAELQS